MNIFKKTILILFIIFCVAAIVRFIYFPENVYFASDQARDAYYSLQVAQGNFKVVGPGTTLSQYLHHGVLYYYIMGPAYYLAQGNPYVPAFLVSMFNLLGVILIFFIAKILFRREIGLLAALLYAVSFEQTQYALFFSHPAPAVITVLLYYLGLSLLLFKQTAKGLPLAIVAGILSMQFHFSLVILIIFLPIFLLLFKNNIPKLKLTDYLLSTAGILLFSSTFILAEIKYKQIISFLMSLGTGEGSPFSLNISNFIFAVNRYVNDNFIISPYRLLGLLFVMTMFILLFRQRNENQKGKFLLIWFLIGCIAYIIGPGTTYYFGMGGSVSLLIVGSYLIYQLSRKYFLISTFLVLAIIGSNTYQIIKHNSYGPSGEIMAPTGMLMKDELQAIDYIYQDAGKRQFSIHALTIPYNVKTTWDFLFNWYGKKQYGFVPVWGGEDALGSEGTLQVIRTRSTLPEKQYLIIEPLSGLNSSIVDDFLREESYFTHLESEKHFGKITVQIRTKY